MLENSLTGFNKPIYLIKIGHSFDKLSLENNFKSRLNYDVLDKS